MNTLKTLALTGVLVFSMVMVSTGFAAGNPGNGFVSPGIMVPKKTVTLPANAVYPFGEIAPSTYSATSSSTAASTTTTTTTTTTPAATTTVTPTVTTTTSNTATLLSYAPADAVGYTQTGEYVGNVYGKDDGLSWFNASPNAGGSRGDIEGRVGNNRNER